jgi:hypothetical protein
MSSKASSQQQQKAIQEVLRRPPSHWVGDGFKVFPGKLRNHAVILYY